MTQSKQHESMALVESAKNQTILPQLKLASTQSGRLKQWINDNLALDIPSSNCLNGLVQLPASPNTELKPASIKAAFKQGIAEDESHPFLS